MRAGVAPDAIATLRRCRDAAYRAAREMAQPKLIELSCFGSFLTVAAALAHERGLRRLHG